MSLSRISDICHFSCIPHKRIVVGQMFTSLRTRPLVSFHSCSIFHTPLCADKLPTSSVSMFVSFYDYDYILHKPTALRQKGSQVPCPCRRTGLQILVISDEPHTNPLHMDEKAHKLVVHVIEQGLRYLSFQLHLA